MHDVHDHKGNSVQDDEGNSELTKRVLIAIPGIIACVAIVLLGGVVFMVGVLIIALLCAHELFRMYASDNPIKLAGYVAIIGLLVAAYWGSERQILLATVLVFPLLFLVSMIMPTHGATKTHGIAITMLGVFWIGFAFAHAVLLRDLPHGEGIIIDILIGTFLGDTAAYLGGKAFGRRKLAPNISPNKTVEGLIIGALITIFAVWCASLYQSWLSDGNALLLGLGIAILAPLGDLFESQVKRDADVKDTGRIMGPHGGLLDRLDALMFTVVGGYYIWLAML
jgi:phosphatidate cytidylyltransferase